MQLWSRSILFLTLISLCVYTAGAQQFTQLVWSDEFDYRGLPNSNKWGYDTGSHGWGNNELQHYTYKRLQNARVKNGKLVIEVRKEPYNGAHYTSARLVTKGRGDWKYGRVDVRAKLPKGRGLWPAIWMLPTGWEYGGWPKSGEIDIMEHVGYMPDSVVLSVHTEKYNHAIATQKNTSVLLTDVYSAYHVYSIEWRADAIDFLIDDKKHFTFQKSGNGSDTWPFDKAFHLLLNVAVGGNWGGLHGVDDSVFPKKMKIDYVRIYQ